MLVLLQVSSIKTSRSGFRLGCASRQAARAATRSGRFCSAACCDFFERQAEPGQLAPQRGQADRDAVRLAQPGAQLGQRRVRHRRNPGAQGLAVAGQPSHLGLAGLECPHLTGTVAPLPRLNYV